MLVGVGLFLLLKHWHFLTHDKWANWPELVMLFGLFFFIFGWVQRETDLLFPAFLLVGFGAYPLLAKASLIWTQPSIFYPLLMGIGFLIRYYKVKKSGLFMGLLLIVFGLYPFFSKTLDKELHQIGSLTQYWPVLLIGLGLFFYFKKK